MKLLFLLTWKPANVAEGHQRELLFSTIAALDLFIIDQNIKEPYSVRKVDYHA